ncbi:MAG: hypothetical protein Q7T41_02510, partial [Candidatus Saccharibacteria bacterium]|nr:hypothetical protein [Candidatus Saccharibacteria bacterium]
VTLTTTMLQLMASIIVLMLALSWKKMNSILEFKFLRWLGKISYTLYATHLIIVFTLNLTLFTKLYGRFSYNFAALLSTALSLLVMFLVAAITHKYVEMPSIKIANKIGEWTKK